MKLLTVVLVSVALPALAQTPPAPTTPPGDPLSTYLKNAETTIQTNIVKSAEKLPEADYAFKPQGASEEVRSFGRLIGHVANANYFFCSRAKGEPIPTKADIEKTVTAKADLVKALNEAFAYCDSVYGSMTDERAMQLMTVPGPNNTTRQIARAQVLIGNLAHNNEHYGNLVTYLRAKGLVPPSSERSSQ
jgi:uncharacterized damage-inducible protein DinB